MTPEENTGPTPAARAPSRRAKLILVVLVPLVFFGLLEAGLRIGGFRYDPRAAFEGGAPADEFSEERIYTPDPELLWKLNPSTTLVWPEGGFPGVRTNAHGLRGPGLPGPRAENELRVLCLGDSVTFGFGLPDGRSWPDWTWRALLAAFPTRRVHVANGAVPGWSSVQGMRLRDRLREFEPDVIVFWYGMNDAKRARDFPDDAQNLPSEKSAATMRMLRSSRVFQLVQSAVTGTRRAVVDADRVSPVRFRQSIDALLEAERAGGPRVVFVRFPERMARTLDQMERLLARVRAAGVDFAIGSQRLLSPHSPVDGHRDFTGRPVDLKEGSALEFGRCPNPTVRPVADIEEAVENLRTRVHSFGELMALLPPGSLEYDDLFGGAAPGQVFTDNCHLSEEGARLAGQALAEVVKRAVADR